MPRRSNFRSDVASRRLLHSLDELEVRVMACCCSWLTRERLAGFLKPPTCTPCKSFLPQVWRVGGLAWRWGVCVERFEHQASFCFTTTSGWTSVYSHGGARWDVGVGVRVTVALFLQTSVLLVARFVSSGSWSFGV